MKISDLGIECFVSGQAKVKVWAECNSPDDIDDIIAWLRLTKGIMERWRKIRDRPAGTEG